MLSIVLKVTDFLPPFSVHLMSPLSVYGERMVFLPSSWSIMFDFPFHFLPTLMFFLRFRLSVFLTDLSNLWFPSRNATGVLHATPSRNVTVGGLPPYGCWEVAAGTKGVHGRGQSLSVARGMALSY